MLSFIRWIVLQVSPQVRANVIPLLLEVLQFIPPFPTDDAINRIKAKRLAYFFPEASIDVTFLAAMLFYSASPMAIIIVTVIAKAVFEARVRRQSLQAVSRSAPSSKYANLGPLAVLFMACLYYILPESLNPYSRTVWMLSVILSIIGPGPKMTLAEPGLLKFVLAVANTSVPVFAVAEVFKPISWGIVFIFAKVLWVLVECFSLGLGTALGLVYAILVAALVSVSAIIAAVTIWDTSCRRYLETFLVLTKLILDRLVIHLVQGAGQNKFSEVRELVKSNFTTTEIYPPSAEYSTISDKVLRYILPVHNWFPVITKIEKIRNIDLELKFENAKLRCFERFTDMKFHGTAADAIKMISMFGFNLPKPKTNGEWAHMYGPGIYFSTDSSKSARKIYTRGGDQLLLCQVLLGRSKVVKMADHSLNLQKLHQEGYDSVFAPRGTKDSGGVENDEFVIFDPDQALPRYIIHYKVKFSQKVILQSLGALTDHSFRITSIHPSRFTDFDDPYKPHLDNATAIFFKVTHVACAKT